jgi:hypothetical protein
MGKYSITVALAGVLLLNLSSSAFAQDSPQKQTSGRRLAMVLPKAPVAPVLPVTTVVPTRAVKLQAVVPAVNPQEEFAGHPRISTPSTSKQIPSNVLSVFIEGATRAEQLSRSYDRHIADLIVWIACSIKDSTTITPLSSPYLRLQRLIEPQPLNQHERMTQID